MSEMLFQTTNFYPDPESAILLGLSIPVMLNLVLVVLLKRHRTSAMMTRIARKEIMYLFIILKEVIQLYSDFNRL